ncbi:MAG: hypothetical protein QM778_26150 [Myxococcales bacterium]
MKVRRCSKQTNLRKLPLDGLDMYLLSCLEGELTVAQLADITATTPKETERRLLELARLGLIEGVEADLVQALTRARRSTRPSLKPASLKPASVKPASTKKKSASNKPEVEIRPPPPSDDDLDAMETLRPLSTSAADLERITPLRPPSLDALFQAEPTGALLKLLTPSRGHPLEEVKIPRKRRSSTPL